MFKKFLALAPILVLASCASLSEDSCRTGDWEGIGYKDGTNGRMESYIGQHREACGEFGIAPDTTRWLRGRIEGLKQYCTAPNVYQLGRRGTEMNPVCAPAQASSLRLANFYGLRYHEISQDIDALEDEKKEILRQLSEDFNGVLTPEQADRQRYLLRQVRQLEREIRDLEWELRKYDDLP